MLVFVNIFLCFVETDVLPENNFTLFRWVTKLYLCHNWPRICSVCRNHNSVLSPFMTYHGVCNYGNTMGATCRAGAAFPYGTPEFTPGFYWGLFCPIISFLYSVCRSLFAVLFFFFFTIVLSVLLRFTISDYPFGIFKLLLVTNCFLTSYIYFHISCVYKLHIIYIVVLSWSWSYGIYQYLCNQCISSLTLWVWFPLMARCTSYNIMW